MKHFLLFTLATIITLNCFSQNLKQYNGEYANGTPNPGKASYSYYMKGDEQMRQDKFIYSIDFKTDEGFYKSSISGNYTKNNKDGIWYHTIELKDYNNGAGNVFITGTITFTSNYSNGIPNGQWIYSSSTKSRSKKFTAIGYEWSAYYPSVVSKATATYNNGVLIGNFVMSNIIENGYDNIVGSFDNNGYMIGTWKFSSMDEETEMFCQKNIVYKYVTRKKSTGAILSKSNFTNDDIALIQQYADGAISYIDLQKTTISIDTVNMFEAKDINLNTTFYNSNFLPEQIPGDNTYFMTGYTLHDLRKPSYRIYADKPEAKAKTDYGNYFERADFYVNDGNFKSALELLKSVRADYGETLSQANLTEIDARIKNYTEKVDSEKKQANNEKQFTEDKYTCKDLITKDQDIIGANITKNRAYFEENILPKYYEYKGATSDYVKQRDLKDEISKLYNKVSNLNYSIFNEYTNQLNKMTVQNGGCQKLITTVESATTVLQNVLNSYNNYILNEYGILFKYTVYNKEKSDQTGQDVIKVNKKPVYESWTIIRDKLLTDFDNNKELINKMNTIQQLAKISKYVLSLADSDSKDVEKLLKGKTDYNEILGILNK